MSSFSRWIPIIGGAVAGGVIALIIAGGSGSNSRSVTTTVTRQQQAALPASFSKQSGMTINQIYRSASPGVVDIVVTAQSTNPGFGFFGGQGGSPEDPGRGRRRGL